MFEKFGSKVAAFGAAMFIAVPLFAWADTYEESHDEWVRERRALEATIIEEYSESLSRDGGILSVMAENGVVATFEDNHCYCSDERHFYVVDFLEPISAFLVEEAGNEFQTFVLLHKPTAQSVQLFARPVVHEKSRQFVVASSDLSDFVQTGIQIGHESDAGLVVDAETALAGYEVAGWVDEDRIALRYVTWMDFYLSKEDQEARGFSGPETRQADLVRQDGVWRLVEITSTPLALPGEAEAP